jgi:ERF superfamily protein
MSLTFTQKVAKIQKELKAPKNQRNNFGKYNYRNQEDILEAVKPLLGDLVLTISDDIVEIGGRVYVKSTSTITDDTSSLSNTAFAREPQEQKGMSDGQLTGATSSYARKYSLNGLFLIDDTKDADTEEFQGKKTDSTPTKQEPKVVTKSQQAEAQTPKEPNINQEPPKQNTNQTPAPKKGGWGNKRASTTTNDSGDLY